MGIWDGLNGFLSHSELGIVRGPRQRSKDSRYGEAFADNVVGLRGSNRLGHRRRRRYGRVSRARLDRQHRTTDPEGRL